VNAGTSDASFFFAIEFKPPVFTNLQKNHSQLDLFHVFLWALSSPPGAEWLIAQKPIPKFLINSYQPPPGNRRFMTCACPKNSSSGQPALCCWDQACSSSRLVSRADSASDAGFYAFTAEWNHRLCVSDAAGSRPVIDKGYLVRHAATLLKLARSTSDPALATALIDKAAELKDRIDDYPDVTLIAPDVEPPPASQAVSPEALRRK